MRKILYFFLMIITMVLALNCTDKDGEKKHRKARPSDTLYTDKKALSIYDYQPVEALKIVDSALAIGNITPLKAEVLRERIYSWTLMGAQVDSFLRGEEGIRYDSAMAIGERLLEHDSAKISPEFRQNVLEVLTTASREKRDTARWLSYSQELVKACHEQKAETEALRTEADVGYAMYVIGKRKQGMARVDSVIGLLDIKENKHFNELDATIIALKRKIKLLEKEGKYIETISMNHRILDLLDDYEKHPDAFSDGTYREPADSTRRADYIDFYRKQAQNRLAAAYASLGELGSTNDIYEQLEYSVRSTTAREHISRYHALEQQMYRTEAESRSRIMTLISVVSVSGLLIVILFATYIYFQNRKIKLKNRALIRQIDESIEREKALEKISAEKESAEAEESATLDAHSFQLFKDIDNTIRTEKLYANIGFQRQDICERFDLRREVLTKLLSKYANATSFPVYINQIRLNEACHLLRGESSLTVNAIAEEVGLSPRNLRRIFFNQYGITPLEYRQGQQESQEPGKEKPL